MGNAVKKSKDMTRTIERRFSFLRTLFAVLIALAIAFVQARGGSPHVVILPCIVADQRKHRRTILRHHLLIGREVARRQHHRLGGNVLHIGVIL